jgi:hypothetical protein
MNTVKAYEEIIEFIAAGTTPDTVVSFRPSPATKTRVSELIHQQKTTGLSSEEKSELDNYIAVGTPDEVGQGTRSSVRRQ